MADTMVTDERITLYAIGALEAHEAAEIERQVAASPELRKRVAEEKAAASALLLSSTPITPPPALKSKLMARLDAEAATPTTPVAAHKPPQTTAPSSQKPAAPGRAGLGDLWRWLFGGLSAAFAALAVVFGIGYLSSQSQVAQLQTLVSSLQAQRAAAQTELQAATARASQAERDLAQAQADLAQAQQAAATAQADAQKLTADMTAAQTRADQAANQLTAAQRELSVLGQKDIRTAALPANKTDFASGNVRVFYSPDGKTALFVVTNLPKLSADKDYQVWLIKDAIPLPSSVFDTDESGTGHFMVESEVPFSAFQNLGITVEPAGGRPTPNPDGPIFLGPIG